MVRVLAAPLAVLGKLQAVLERLFVLRAVVADLTAFRALKFDEIILRHIRGQEWRYGKG